MIDEILSHYPRKARSTPIPTIVRDEVKKRMLDSLGCFYGAFKSKPSQLLRQTFLKSDQGPATVWGEKKTASPELAAWINGSCVRTLDYNDTYLSKEPCHPSDLIAPLWACAEQTKGSRQGRDLIKAILLSYEVMCRLCDAQSIRLRGWDHVTYLPIASAVGCSFLLNLSPEKTRHAIALSLIGNNAMRQTRVGTISDWKAACAAYAARSGLWAARLAQSGFTGPSDVFSGRHGFFNQVSGQFSFSTKKLGAPWAIMRTHTKFFPAEHHSQSAIEAAIAIRKKINPKKVQKIVVSTFDVAVQIIGSEKEKWMPTTRETADHSMPYLVVAALLDGDINLRQYERKRYNAPLVKKLLKRTSVKHDSRLTRLYPKRLPVKLTFHQSGRPPLSIYRDLPKGYAGNPMDLDQVTEKFHRLARSHRSLSRRRSVIRRIMKMESISNIKTLRKIL